MTFTARYAHLQNPSDLLISETVVRGDKVGRMGSSGQSKHNHLHIDVVEGLIDNIIRLNEIGYEAMDTYRPNIRQLNYFIDRELFDKELVITTPFYDPKYKELFGKDHPAYDLVPLDRHLTKEHYDIYWNRSVEGVVLNKGYDETGYGNYVLIGFEI